MAWLESDSMDHQNPKIEKERQRIYVMHLIQISSLSGPETRLINREIGEKYSELKRHTFILKHTVSLAVSIRSIPENLVKIV